MTNKAELPNTVTLLSSLSDISREAWDRAANPGWRSENPLAENAPRGPIAHNPFVSHNFLWSLEESGSAVPETGWYGRHIVLGDTDDPLAIVPAYLKTHSQGEYVFDYGWADAFERAGGRYYPKLQISVPFTPATSRRLLIADLTREDAVCALLANAIQSVTNQYGASSAHATFLTEREWLALGKNGFLRRNDQQFHWQNHDYADYEEFLSNLSSSKRKALRKERRRALENNITVKWITGSDLTDDHLDAFFEFYQDTGSRKWGSPYLTREFFSLAAERMANEMLLIMAYRDGRAVAGALNFIGSETLYGRYWGCIEDHPFLHFEICYHQAIDYAIKFGLKSVEAGAQGAHKLARGYVPTMTYSAHWIANSGFRSAVENFLEQERFHVKLEQEALSAHTPFKKSGAD